MFENIDAMLKMRKAWSTFNSNHPKFAAFLGTVGRRGLGEGTILDIRVTYPDGTSMETNMKVTASDLELLEQMKQLAGSMNKK